MRLRIKLDVTTDVEVEKIDRLLRGIEKGGKIRINENGLQIIEMKPKGRPGELPAQIIEYLQGQKKPRSATQIARAIERLKPSVNAALRRMKAKGHVISEWDARWRVARYTVTADGIADIESYNQAKLDAPKNAERLRKWIQSEDLESEDEITYDMAKLDLGLMPVEYRTAMAELIEAGEVLKTFEGGSAKYWLV